MHQNICKNNKKQRLLTPNVPIMHANIFFFTFSITIYKYGNKPWPDDILIKYKIKHIPKKYIL